MAPTTAESLAAGAVASVHDDPVGRLRFMRHLYEHPTLGRRRLPYRRAAAEFMRWQLDRGLLGATGSPWWREVNADLLRVTAEARYLVEGATGAPSCLAVSYGVEFIERPTARSWYRSHNAAIVGAYLDHHDLAEKEGRVERFFLNLILLRVLYAHALVAAPRLALGWLGPVGPLLGDPRLGMTGIFLSLSRVLPSHYPLGEDVAPFVADEHGFGRVLDVGVIQPRLRALYDWSAAELGEPRTADLLVGQVPSYAWDPSDDRDWTPSVTGVTRWARRAVPIARHAGGR